MKRFRVMAAALCAVVLLCGFSVPAYAYADGGEGADYGDSTMTEETSSSLPSRPAAATRSISSLTMTSPWTKRASNTKPIF